MKIGTVKEIKRHEYRVGLTPDCVRRYVTHGHEVLIEAGAGAGTGYSDSAYTAAGGTIAASREEVFAQADMIVKVKEPQPDEFALLREDQILYTYLHLAPAPELTRALLDRKVKGVAYETIEEDNGLLPCLKPMSEIAGRLSIQEGAKYLEKPYGGGGVLLSGVPGVPRGRVVIVGAGTVGMNACKMAVGIGADVTILDISAERLTYIDDIFSARINTLYSTESNLATAIAEADLVVGAVLITGAAAPKLITRKHLSIMKPGAVIVDVAVDQGGCCETTRATTHDDPVFTEEGIVHYCVANMPGAVALTSTLALTSTTLRHGIAIADLGLEEACRQSAPLARGVNTYAGKCMHPQVAESLGMPCASLNEVMS
jgi:alanine dehydrogenase